MPLPRSRKMGFSDMRNQNMKTMTKDIIPSTKPTPFGWRREAVRKTISNVNKTQAELDLLEIHAYIQEKFYLVSAVLGDTKKPYNSCKGYVGLFAWIFDLAIHFSLDFYEASVVFHVSWASSIALCLFMFVICTIFIIKSTIPWYLKTTKKLARESTYKPILKKLKVIFRVRQ